MALYTGIVAYNIVEGSSVKAISKTPFYSEYVNCLNADESYGGYPTFEYLLDFLLIDEDIIDTDENYEKHHKLYTEEIEEIQSIVHEIDKYKLLDKVKSKEIAFITRNNGIALAFGKLFEEKEFYFRRVVSYEELLGLIDNTKDVYDLSWTLEEINKLKDTHIFEIHVS